MRIKKQHFIKSFFLTGFLLPSAVLLPTHTKAQGIIVLDPAEVQNGIKEVAQGAESLLNQASELQDWMIDLAAPAAYVWDNATQTMQQLQNLAYQYQYYTQYGGIQGYLDNFKNTSFYSSSPCYQLSLSCDRQKLWQDKEKQSEVQTQANKGALKTFNAEQNALSSDGRSLDLLSKKTELARGGLAAQQQTNMLLSHIAHQQNEQRATQLASATAEANERAQRTADQAKADAFHKALFSTDGANPYANSPNYGADDL